MQAEGMCIRGSKYILHEILEPVPKKMRLVLRDANNMKSAI